MSADAAQAALARLDEITRRLRRECPWDREQDARSIVPHTVEEAYELADAADAGDDRKLLDELGDVLFACVAVARQLGADPELALRGAALRFRSRVERAAALAAEAGERFEDLAPGDQLAWYARAKTSPEVAAEGQAPDARR